jgi:uncharacterized protein YabE (DUF348 family)
LRAKLAQAAVVAVLSVSAIAYGAMEKHVIVRVEDSTFQVRTFAGTVADALERAHVTLGPKDVVRPSLDTHIHEGLVIEVRRAKPITLLLNGKPRQVIVTGLTVEEVIREMNLRASLADYVGASRSARVTAGMLLVYREAVGIRVVHDSVTEAVITNAATVQDVLTELGLKLAGQDQVTPAPSTPPSSGLVVQVLRIGTRVETRSAKIPYPTILKGDSGMERGQREVRQGGRSGEKIVSLRVTYKDGRRVSAQEISSKVVRRPRPKIVAVGTGPRCICTRGTQTGNATWYRRTGLTAAHPTLPMGTVVRVTNLENGKTVTVTINDRGPWGDGRIIDLSDDAFARIADLSDGVVRVRIRW